MDIVERCVVKTFKLKKWNKEKVNKIKLSFIDKISIHKHLVFFKTITWFYKAILSVKLSNIMNGCFFSYRSCSSLLKLQNFTLNSASPDKFAVTFFFSFYHSLVNCTSTKKPAFIRQIKRRNERIRKIIFLIILEFN